MNRAIALGLLIACFLGVNLSGTCLAAYVQWDGNGHWYEVVYVENGISWTVAKAAAEAAGGYLATSTSEEENAFLFSLINDNKYWYWDGDNYEGPWLGGYQTDNGGGPGDNWAWVSGEPWSYTNWESRAGAPNDRDGTESGEEDYLAFFTMGGSGTFAGKWNDLPDMGVHFSLQGERGYIIEYDANPVPLPGAVWLLGSGMLGLVAARRKKKI